MESIVERAISAFEAWVFLDDTPGPIYLIEHFQGVAFQDYDYDERGDKFDLTLYRQDDDDVTLTFNREVKPDVLLAALQRYARQVSNDGTGGS